MEGYKTLKTNDVVGFEVSSGDNGPQAADVKVTEAAEEVVSET